MGTNRSSPTKRLEWQFAVIRDIVVETYRVKSLMLQLAAGQDTCQASTSISGSQPRMAIKRNVVIPSPLHLKTNCLHSPSSE